MLIRIIWKQNNFEITFHVLVCVVAEVTMLKVAVPAFVFRPVSMYTAKWVKMAPLCASTALALFETKHCLNFEGLSITQKSSYTSYMVHVVITYCVGQYWCHRWQGCLLLMGWPIESCRWQRKNQQRSDWQLQNCQSPIYETKKPLWKINYANQLLILD